MGMAGVSQDLIATSMAGPLLQALGQLFEHVRGAAFVVDRENTVVGWSSAAAAEFGVPSAQAIGRHCLASVGCEPCLGHCGMMNVERHSSVVVAVAGRRRTYRRSTFPLRADDGSFAGGIEILVPQFDAEVDSGELTEVGPAATHDPAFSAQLLQARALVADGLPVHVEGADLLTRANVVTGLSQLATSGGAARIVAGASLRVEDVESAFPAGRPWNCTLVVDDVGGASPVVQRLLVGVMARAIAPELASGRRSVLITTSDRSLEDEVHATRVSPELARWLKPVRVRIPVLGKRPRDVMFEVGEFIERQRRAGRPVEVERASLDAIRRHPWVGVAELLLHLGAAVARGGGRLDIDTLRDEPAGSVESPADEATRRRIARVLREHDGDLGSAATALGMSRSTLWRWRRRMGL